MRISSAKSPDRWGEPSSWSLHGGKTRVHFWAPAFFRSNITKTARYQSSKQYSRHMPESGTPTNLCDAAPRKVHGEPGEPDGISGLLRCPSLGILQLMSQRPVGHKVPSPFTCMDRVARMCECMDMCICIYIYVYMYICIFGYLYVYIYMKGSPN